MGCCLWHSSSGPFYTVQRARHRVTPQSVGLCQNSPLSEKLRFGCWQSPSVTCHKHCYAQAQMTLQCTCVNAFPKFTTGSNVDNRVSGGKFVWKQLSFNEEGVNSTNLQGRILCINFVPAIVMCKSLWSDKAFYIFKDKGCHSSIGCGSSPVDSNSSSIFFKWRWALKFCFVTLRPIFVRNSVSYLITVPSTPLAL